MTQSIHRSDLDSGNKWTYQLGLAAHGQPHAWPHPGGRCIDGSTLLPRESKQLMSNLAGLLTYPIVTRPSHPRRTVTLFAWQLAGITAAGLFRIHTWFPFNPRYNTTWSSWHQVFGGKITLFLRNKQTIRTIFLRWRALSKRTIPPDNRHNVFPGNSSVFIDDCVFVQ